MKDLMALAQKIKIVPGSFEEPLRDGGESVGGTTSVGNMVCAEEIPCQKKKKVTYHVENLRTYTGKISNQRERIWQNISSRDK